MGAPKQKWTKDEEAALRAGIDKYGPGKWSAILKDPLLSAYLSSRSNVDLKDKWRNINVTANGWGSREKARLAFKKSSQLAKQTGRPLALPSIPNEKSSVAMDAKPLAAIVPYQSPDSTRSIPRLDNLIMDAISNMKEPKGSNKSAIASYIEDHNLAPSSFKKMLSPKLKSLTDCGKLVKLGQNYMINGGFLSGDGGARSAYLRQERTQAKRTPYVLKHTSKRYGDDIPLMTKAEVEAELSRMTTMDAEEAARFAAKAVTEAEMALAELEEATREMEVADADLEAAKAFADAMRKLRNSRNC